MNVRDPFNRHRALAFDILRGTAFNAAQATRQVIEVGTQVYDTGKQAVEEMSFSVPNNVPSFTNPQRELENRVWGASGITARSAAAHSNGGVMSGVQDRVGGFFEKNRGDLPMYKDKPYSYAASRRHRSIWKQKRTWGIAGLFGFLVLYFLGFFGTHAEASKKAKEGWSWLQRPEKGGSKVDWLDRRERVKEAFTLSWDAYDRYAWGMSNKSCHLLSLDLQHTLQY
jgi:endoplasmic reticulum Man9GlcNAc2 1,2-alpha-mannosidase